jgi:hypothetical protein
MSKCPVCDWEIKDKGVLVKVGGKTVVTCCDDCAAKVKADPAKYTTERRSTAKKAY